MKRFKGYFNYYKGGTFKSYNFKQLTSKQVASMRKHLQGAAESWVGEMIVEDKTPVEI